MRDRLILLSNIGAAERMAAQLLSAAVERQADVPDERLYFEIFAAAKRAGAPTLCPRAGR